MKNVYDNDEFYNEYSKMERSQFGLECAGEWEQLLPMLPNLSKTTILDLGCGYGWHCAYAAKQGANLIVGIDQSEKMLNEAKKRNGALNIEYYRCDLLEYDYPNDTYDLVLANLVLHYIEDLKKVYRLVHKTLKEDGCFVFNIEHPTFTAGINQQWHKEGFWPVDNYFYPGEVTTDFLGCEVKKYHHTLTQILNDLIKCGFIIEIVEEVIPPEKWRVQLPDEMRRPMMLLVKAKKNANHGGIKI